MSPEQRLLEFWRSVIDPSGIGMAEALASELGAYTGESRSTVLDKMGRGTKALTELWEQRKVDRNNSESVTAFYRDQFIEAYELANWHAGRTNAEPPLNYARAATFAKTKKLRTALDFGSGIGSGSLALAHAGCEVHSADIANELLQFVGHRLRSRGFEPHLIDLCSSERPRPGYFDIITCFDVLEHVPNQLEKLYELEGYLKPGGVLFVNLMEDSGDDNRPMHISSAGRWLRLVRKTGLVPDWKFSVADCNVLIRQGGAGRLRNSLASVVDRLQGL